MQLFYTQEVVHYHPILFCVKPAWIFHWFVSI